jgi:hypothetical protein
MPLIFNDRLNAQSRISHLVISYFHIHFSLSFVSTFTFASIPPSLLPFSSVPKDALFNRPLLGRAVHIPARNHLRGPCSIDYQKYRTYDYDCEFIGRYAPTVGKTNYPCWVEELIEQNLDKFRKLDSKENCISRGDVAA